MKSTWLPWIAGLLGGVAAAGDRAVPTAPRGEVPRATPARKPPVDTRSMPTDPYAPFRIADDLVVPPQPDMHWNGMQPMGSSSGPVNTERPDRAFFTDPRFGQGDNSGRLFYHQTFLSNPHDPFLPERRAWFLCWSPLGDGARAQRLHERPGFLIGEVTTDGNSILIHHVAHPGEGTHTDTMRWNGDALGQGRFELVGAAPALPGMAEPTESDRHRDRGYALLSARKWAEAADAFESALRARPGDAAVLFALGVAWEEQGLRDPQATARAIQAFSDALGSDPRRTPALRHRAAVYARMGQQEQAIQDLSQVILATPQDWEPHLDRARLHAGVRDFENAIQDAAEAARKAPTESEPLEKLALYQYHAGHLVESVGTGRRLLALDDSHTAVRVTMACAQARSGDGVGALQTYAEARANGVSNPERRRGLRELARALRDSSAKAPQRDAIQRLQERLRGTDQLEPAEGDTD